jgi:osmotically-inducible protein OsmY
MKAGGAAHRSFRGRGPLGYRRSDERIREDACESLTQDDRVDASNIEVRVKDCEVTLSGSVNSRDEKRRAEDLIERLSGVKDVNNSLRVARQDEDRGSEG